MISNGTTRSQSYVRIFNRYQGRINHSGAPYQRKAEALFSYEYPRFALRNEDGIAYNKDIFRKKHPPSRRLGGMAPYPLATVLTSYNFHNNF